MSDIDLIKHARRVVERHGMTQSTILIDNLADALESTTARLREAEAVIEDIRVNAAELLDADDDSYDGSLSATWVVDLIARHKTTKTDATDREDGAPMKARAGATTRRLFMDRENHHHDEGCADFYSEYGAPEGGVCKVCGEQVTDRENGSQR